MSQNVGKDVIARRAHFSVGNSKGREGWQKEVGVQGINDHCRVLWEVEWGDNCHEHQVERLVPVYHKTNVPGLQSFFRGKFTSRASNGSCVEEIWKRVKEIVFESIDHFVPP